jgi:DNA (cytosine-5)-methyltransferase 1
MTTTKLERYRQGSLFEKQSKKKLNSSERPWSIFGEGPRDEQTCSLTHVSLFSGCGGFDLGFRAAGFKTVFANDINSDACCTYRKNLGEIYEADLRDIGPPKLKKRPDVVTAGFPCQPFSNAGSRRGVQDTRGTLFQSAIDIVKALRPRSVVFENVRGLLSIKNGKQPLAQDICEQLDSLGYDVVFSLIDSSNHNVPQKRLRVLFVGIEKAGKAGSFAFPEPTERDDLSIAHTILDIKKGTPNQNELMQLNPQAIQIGSMVPEGGSWKDIPYEKLPPRLKRIKDNIARYRWPKFYRRFHRDEIAGTVTAAFKPENAGVWHPIEKRIFSVREIARIQTFPDWFLFEGRTVKSKYQQIGNAVPPRLAFELGKQVALCLSGKDLLKNQDFLTYRDLVVAGRPLRACHRNILFSGNQKVQ